GPRDEEKFPFENQFCSILLCQLTAPVRENVGNRSAVATPIWAVAAWICASASRISGRRRHRSEGKPTGTAGGGMGDGRVGASPGSKSAGGRARSTLKA